MLAQDTFVGPEIQWWHLSPVLALLGHHHFIAYLVKLLDHSSRLLALAGWPILTQREI